MGQPTRSSALSHANVDQVMHGVVQIVALQRGFMGNYQPAWTGSGTIVDSRGLILTNCHVANPRAMGMTAPAADMLAVAITQRSDEAPALTYVAQVAAMSPELDLAVLKIVSGLNGKPVSNLNLTAIALGDSDALELGDELSIFGYPGIGGETVTLTRGTVSGFSKQDKVADHRAWIKTDATIAGGNSGGTAVNDNGQLVGVPTQAAAGSGVTPVDARPVVDTNRDGRVDEHDTPMAIGGFINGLRPVKLAQPLLAKAGMATAAAASGAQPAPKPAAPRPTSPQPPSPLMPGVGPEPSPVLPGIGVQPSATTDKGPVFRTLVFSTQVTSDGRPINAAALLPSGSKALYASFEYEGMRNGVGWSQVWAVDGNTVVTDQGKWDGGGKGRRTIALNNPKGLPDGQYHLVLGVQSRVLAEGQVVVGRRVDDTDTEISGQVVDQATGRGINDALVIALRPTVRVQDFVQQQRREMAFSSARTDAAGKFTLPQQLPKGQAYGLVVVARGYRDLAIEGALRISAQAPEQAQLSPIPLTREK
jgi:serine protease Do